MEGLGGETKMMFAIIQWQGFATWFLDPTLPRSKHRETKSGFGGSEYQLPSYFYAFVAV